MLAPNYPAGAGLVTFHNFVFSVCLCTAWSPVAADARGRAAVAVVPIEGATHDLAGALTDALRAAVEAHPDRLPTEQVALSLDEARMSFSCFEEQPACMIPIAQLFDADRLVWGQVTDDGVELKELDVKTATIRRSAVRLPLGGAPLTAALPLAEAFIDGKALPPIVLRVPLRISSTPAGARIFVDGEPAGLTPLQFQARPGTRLIELRLGDAPPLRRQIVVGTEAQVIDFQLRTNRPVPRPRALVREPAPVDPDSAGAGSPRFWLGVGAGGVAVLAASFGTVLGLDVLDLADRGASARGGERADLKTDFDDRRFMTNMSWAVAGVAAGASAYFLLISDDDGTVALSPTPTGLLLNGAF